MVIRVPDPNSVYGYITRVTPHWFHVFYYRLLGNRNAGKPGYAPYPVYYNQVISRGGIRDFCGKNNLTLLAEYGDGYWRPGKGIAMLLIHLIKIIISTLTLGKLSSKHTNLLYILKVNSK